MAARDVQNSWVNVGDSVLEVGPKYNHHKFRLYLGCFNMECKHK